MEVQKLVWDSDFFKLRIGSIFLSNDFDINSFVKNWHVLNRNFDLIYVYSDKKLINTFFIDKMVDIKLVYRKNLSPARAPKYEGIKVIPPISSEHFITEELYSLVYKCGEFSRFNIDKRFSQESFKNLYSIWLEKSLKGEIADKFFVYKIPSGKIVGFLTVKKTEDGASLGLMAVDEQYRRMGIAHKLINSVENYCRDNGIEQLSVPTQSSNVRACTLYEKIGFHLHSKDYIYHIWA